MKCPKKNKFCLPETIERSQVRSQYICVGVNKKPTKWKKDVIKLCLNGEFVKDFTIEMTPEEALLIARGLLIPIKIK